MPRSLTECRICGNQRWLYESTPNRDNVTCIPCQALVRFFANPAGDWVVDGLCGQVDPELFFPRPNADASDAKAVCRECPVRTQCLAYALENEERWGIWGGMTPAERKRLLKKGTAA
jgi:hypothetical protein